MFVQQNKVSSIQEYYFTALKEVYPVEEIGSIIAIVFFHLKGWSKVELRMNSNETLSESELLEFHWVLKRLKTNEPVQYIIGESEFYGLSFVVNQHVLIPRQETEELVDLVLRNCFANETILDIGTGSGCIPIALKKSNSALKTIGVDISKEAIEVAKLNAEKNQVEVEFIERNILNVKSIDELVPEVVNIIISNPPYITEKEMSMMHQNVLAYEPKLALFVPNEAPLMFYDKIGRLAYNKLNIGGKLYFEVNEHFGKETSELLEEIGFSDICLIKDLQEKDRIIVAIR